MANTTKNAILETLGGLLQTRQLDDITVTELVEQCGISRQAFYYHFSDLYGVVDYAIQLFMEQLAELPPENWKKALDLTVSFLREHRTMVLNAYRAYERSYVEHYLRRWAKPLVLPKALAAAERQGVTQDQAEFVTDLFTQALVGIMLSWVERGLPNSAVERLDDFHILMEGCMDFMMERLAQKDRLS